MELLSNSIIGERQRINPSRKRNGQKINAIKHYRHVMKETFNQDIGLKGAKDYVDSLQTDMHRRGILP